MCVCVCVTDRQTDIHTGRDRERDRERQRETEAERVIQSYVIAFLHSCSCPTETMEGVGTSGVPSSNHTASSEAIPAARPGSGAASDSLHGSSGSAQSWNSKSSRLFSSPQDSYKPRYKMEVCQKLG